jgi:hypothetical protein
VTRDSVESGVMLLGLGVAGWLAYQAWQTLKVPTAAVGAAANAAGNAIANLFPGTSASVIPQGVVILPGGQSVPVASMVNNGFQSDGTLQMSYAGTTYVLSSAGNGSYNATMAGLGSVARVLTGQAY